MSCISTVMAGLDPAIHAEPADDVDQSMRKHPPTKGLRQVPHPVDAKVEPWHDDVQEAQSQARYLRPPAEERMHAAFAPDLLELA